MHETAADIVAVQELLDRSYGAAGPHLRSITTPERRVSAAALCEQLTGMRLLVVATVTADGRPIAGPVDGMRCNPSNSKRAYGISSGRASARTTSNGSMPNTFGTPGGASRCITGQRLRNAIACNRGSGLTATGCPTARSSGTSYTLSL